MRRGWLAAGLLAVLVACAGPAAADWRDTVKVLRIGILAGDNPSYRSRQAEPFRDYMRTRLGVPVEIFPAPTYEALIEALDANRVQYAVLGATAYAVAALGCDCVEPLALPAAEDGSRGYFSVLVVRAESPITSLATCRGARLALSEGDSIAGRLVPLKAFAAEGIDPDSHFSSVEMVASPEAAITALLAGTVDAAIGWSSVSGDTNAGYSRGVLAKMVGDGTLGMDQIRIVWRSPLIPYGPHAVRKDVPDDLKDLLRQSLLEMARADPAALDAIDRGGGGGFVAATDADYAILREVVSPPPGD